MTPGKCDCCAGPLPADNPGAFHIGPIQLCAACYHSDSPKIQDLIDHLADAPEPETTDPS